MAPHTHTHTNSVSAWNYGNGIRKQSPWLIDERGSAKRWAWGRDTCTVPLSLSPPHVETHTLIRTTPQTLPEPVREHTLTHTQAYSRKHKWVSASFCDHIHLFTAFTVSVSSSQHLLICFPAQNSFLRIPRLKEHRLQFANIWAQWWSRTLNTSSLTSVQTSPSTTAFYYPKLYSTNVCLAFLTHQFFFFFFHIHSEQHNWVNKT